MIQRLVDPPKTRRQVEGAHPDQAALIRAGHYCDPWRYTPQEAPCGARLWRVAHGLPEGVPLLPGGTPVLSTDAAYEPPEGAWDVDEWEAACSEVYFYPSREAWRKAWRQVRCLARAKLGGRVVTVMPIPSPQPPAPDPSEAQP